jgi:hypothetical protein
MADVIGLPCTVKQPLSRSQLVNVPPTFPLATVREGETEGDRSPAANPSVSPASGGLLAGGGWGDRRIRRPVSIFFSK